MTTRGTRSDTRRDAINAARKLLEPRLELVGDLADAGAAIDAAEEAVRAAEHTLLQSRRTYLDHHRAALKGGWSEEQLNAAGCPAERGRARRRRRTTTPTDSHTGANDGAKTAPSEANDRPAVDSSHPSAGDVPVPHQDSPAASNQHAVESAAAHSDAP